jgi:hypothetical protein
MPLRVEGCPASSDPCASFTRHDVWHSGCVVRSPDEIAVRAVFSVSSGPALVGEWTWAQVRDGSSPDWVHADPPAWLRDPEMSWKDRHGPIEVRANVPPGMEDAARALLAGSRS